MMVSLRIGTTKKGRRPRPSQAAASFGKTAAKDHDSVAANSGANQMETDSPPDPVAPQTAAGQLPLSEGATVPPSAPYGQVDGKTAAYLATIPTKHRPRMAHVLGGGHATHRDRITAMCLTCSGFQFEEVRECMVRKCPLQAVRPYQIADTGHEPGEEVQS
ncbi:hypothetical protein QTI24_01485 [Variovorax sp. J22P240]|uniref:hypothetical protein n=1 Tax=Variovorax sp. J22P240 TaxID=3053514 RepID=UPI0025790CD8|nr:hypothetical protein [Variovorax sp. J22P240]MDL9997254.1 hypothetical protein [Variovorax sp. J22P240]